MMTKVKLAGAALAAAGFLLLLRVVHAFGVHGTEPVERGPGRGRAQVVAAGVEIGRRRLEFLLLHLARKGALHSGRDQSDHKPYNRKELGSTRQRVALVGQSGNRNSGHELKRQQKLVYRFPHSAALTPADENVAISLNMLTAASINIMASTAPVPSPRRIPRFKMGSSPM